MAIECKPHPGPDMESGIREPKVLHEQQRRTVGASVDTNMMVPHPKALKESCFKVFWAHRPYWVCCHFEP